MSVAEAAQVLYCSKNTVYRHIEGGRLSAVRAGVIYRIHTPSVYLLKARLEIA